MSFLSLEIIDKTLDFEKNSRSLINSKSRITYPLHIYCSSLQPTKSHCINCFAKNHNLFQFLMDDRENRNI
jgi:hypothetical protein